jgi:hypothetical protein
MRRVDSYLDVFGEQNEGSGKQQEKKWGPDFHGFFFIYRYSSKTGVRDHCNIELRHVRGAASIEPPAPMQSGRGQMNRCLVSSFPESGSSVSTNGLRVDPG